jgi:hypothetical protein
VIDSGLLVEDSDALRPLDEDLGCLVTKAVVCFDDRDVSDRGVF